MHRGGNYAAGEFKGAAGTAAATSLNFTMRSRYIPRSFGDEEVLGESGVQQCVSAIQSA